MIVLKPTFVALLVIPRLLCSQYFGLSVARVSSTVDWQFPPPPASCDFCITDASPNSNRSAYAPAITMQWRADRWLGLASELRYTPKGYAVTTPTLNVEYLEVPLLARLGKLVNANFPVSMFAEGGPALAIRVDCEIDYGNGIDDCSTHTRFGDDWRVRPFDISAVGGFGVAVHLGDGVLISGARVDWGLADINRSEGVPTKNRSTLWYVGWLWKWSDSAPRAGDVSASPPPA